MIKKVSLRSYATQIFSQIELSGVVSHYLNFPVALEKLHDIDSFIRECESETRSLKAAGSHRINDWEMGWSGPGVVGVAEGAPEDGLPYYFKKNTHLRLGDNVYLDQGGYAEFAMLRVLQSLVFKLSEPILGTAHIVIEYGCGTGHNIQYLKSQMPAVCDWGGCDWAQSAIERIVTKKIVRSEFARRVDYFCPDTFWAPPTSFVAFTNASLEQSGDYFKAFMDFLISSEDCVGGIHIEPIMELLGESALDRNAYRYAEQRGYLGGFLNYLERKKVKILHKKNYGIGSKYLSGYQVIIWIH